MKYLLILPAILLSALFFLWPIAAMFKYSLLKTNFITTTFVGLDNYARAFTDPDFLLSWLNSMSYMVFMVIGQVGGGLAIALTTMNLSKRWHDTVRMTFYVPTLSAGIIIAQVWRWVFHSRGPLNWIVILFGGESVAWFSQGVTAIPSISLIVVASGLGGAVIYFLAAILSIDRDLFSAAQIDGASWFQIKTRIVAPVLRPIVATLALLAAIASFQVFETIYALAPYTHTATVTYHVYREAFVMGRYGLGSAQAFILLVAMMGLALVKRRVEA